MIAICLLLCLQDRVDTVDVKEKLWTVRGTSSKPEGTELVVALRRVERRWDTKASRFTEFLSDETRVRATASIAKSSFSVAVRPAPEGIYQAVIADGETILYDGRVAAAAESLFRSTNVRVKVLIEIGGRTTGFLDEIGALLKGDVKPTPRLLEDFVKRVSRDEVLVDEIARETDLTATVAILRGALSHARNAQVWSLQKRTASEEDDGVLGTKGHFLDPDLTLGTLRDSVTAIPSVLSAELRLSVAALLDGRLTAERAKQAAELLKSAPEPDKTLVAALESDLAAAAAALKAVVAR
jgi:hypothetical protein